MTPNASEADPGVKCDACGKMVPRIMFRPLDGQGRCVSCSVRGVPYGAYLHPPADSSSPTQSESLFRVVLEDIAAAWPTCEEDDCVARATHVQLDGIEEHVCAEHAAVREEYRKKMISKKCDPGGDVEKYEPHWAVKRAVEALEATTPFTRNAEEKK